jgi:small subunit ribosomal protein S16
MLKIRLQRVGKKNQPSFRLVLVDSRRAARSGSFIEILGSYDVRKKESRFKDEKIKEWLKKGAKLSETVHNLLVDKKIIDAPKIDILKHNKIKNRKKEELTKEEKKENIENTEIQQAESVEAAS